MEIRPTPPPPTPTTHYEAMGGAPTFARLTQVFYEGVASDDELRAMYPEADLGPAEERLRLFLEQYWGGPTTYHEQRGHPRLRMRHGPFVIGPRMRDAWLTHMRAAVDTVVAEGLLGPEFEPVLWEYLARAAQFMVNSTDG